jgi:hypothetical protein
MSPYFLFAELLAAYPEPDDKPEPFHPAPCNHGIPPHLVPGANVCHGCEPEINREL